MKRLLIVGICVSLFSILLICEGAMTYQNITEDNEVYTKEEVRVEEADDTPTTTILTLNSLNTRRQVLVTQIANKQAELIVLDALIISVNTEALMVVLKIPE